MDDHADELCAESPQDELWLVSYSDLLTLLTAFFAVLVAAAPTHRAGLEQIASSLTGGPPPLETLQRQVEQLAARGGLSDRIHVSVDGEGLAIAVADALLFDSGSAEVRPEAKPLIGAVGQWLAKLPGRAVVIEGHTDDVPIHTATFRSNWELSSQRAIDVLALLEAAGVTRERMSVHGYAETRMPREGTIAERRALGRKVVIRVE